jgi:hypothetical protein
VVLANVGLILVSRSRHEMLLTTIRRPNPALGWIVGAAILGLALVLCVEPLREMFRFGPLTGYQVLLSVALPRPALVGWRSTNGCACVPREFEDPSNELAGVVLGNQVSERSMRW